MDLKQNLNLKKFNTFGISALAAYFSQADNLDDLQEGLEYIRKKNMPFLILGGGSNLLFTKNFDGFVLRNALKGITVQDNGDKVIVKALAGENWHEFVMYCIENHFCGMENLSLIPGCVGASPMQNIGAYGVEIKDFFYSLEAIELKTGATHTFFKDDCRFGYRESVFKNIYKNAYVIISVSFELKKHADLNISYGAITQELEKMHVVNPGIKDVSQAVINIRRSKLPDPLVIGNAGSFFKNPVVENSLVEKIRETYPDVVHYPVDEHHSKLAAGWLIERAGWKGYRNGDAGVHQLQALVLVNYGNAKGDEILKLSGQIIEDIKTKFGVELEREVNII
jgi:UDP-N-acetylmuramate dehydrogenase